MKFQSLFVIIIFSNSLIADIPNHAIADLVIGKPNYTAEREPNYFFPEYRPPVVTSEFTIGLPEDIAIAPKEQKLFISDTTNNRVLRYANYNTFKIGQAAEIVFGQPDFKSNLPATSELGMRSPKGIFFDTNGRLWVADSGNDRILMFENACGLDATRPDKVLGQPDFITLKTWEEKSKLVGSLSNLSRPEDICVDRFDRIWVADTYNGRVLRFDSISSKPSFGSSADGVLGSETKYDYDGFPSPSKIEDRMGTRYPSSVAIAQNGILFVADSGNNRVLRFDNPLIQGGNVASGVFGKPNFIVERKYQMTDFGPWNEPSILDDPGGLTVTPNNDLWVTNRGLGKNCIILYKNALTSNKVLQDRLVGKYSLEVNAFESKKRNIYNPRSCYVDSEGRLLVSDSNSNRVLRYPEDKQKPTAIIHRLLARKLGKNSYTVTIQGDYKDNYSLKYILCKIDNGKFRRFKSAHLEFSFTTKKKKGRVLFILEDENGNRSRVYGGNFELRG